MRLFLLAFLTIFSLNFFFASCEKDKCDDCGGFPEDTTKNPVDTTNNNVAGPLRIGVRIYTPAGPFAGGAQVKLARSFDSVNQEKYFLTGTTDSSGYIVFNNLYAPPGGEKSYYINADFEYNGEDLSSTNPNGNGPLEVRLRKGITRNAMLVVTGK